MKKRLIISILGFIVTVAADDLRAQVIKSYGVKGAITWADQIVDWSGIPDPSTRRRMGFNVGGFVEWFSFPVVSVVTQFEYAQRGCGNELHVARFTSSGAVITETVVFYTRLDYLSFPVFVKAEIPSAGIRPFVAIGPRADVFLSSSTSNGPVFLWMVHQKKSVVFGGSVSAGMTIVGLLPFVLTVEGRYNHDFTASYTNPVITIKNDAFDLWVGVAL